MPFPGEWMLRSKYMQFVRPFLVLIISVACALAQTADTKQRIRAVRDLGKLGSESISKLEPYLADPDTEVRVEAVKSLIAIGTARSIDPLLKATLDNDPEVQIRATDGLVNFYSPGYIKAGRLSGSIKRAGSAIRAKFTDTNDLVIDPYIQVRPEIIAALGKLARVGASMDSRANAARALGILRGKAAVDDLIEATRSKDDQVLHESLIALQKIHDETAGPRILFLVRDLNENVKIPAIETVGLLRTKEAIPDLRDVLEHSRNIKVRRAALTALAMLADETTRSVFSQYLNDKDDGLRAAAAEGFGRLKNPSDLPMMEKAFNSESKMNPRLSQAFACVSLGRNDISEFSPLRYLVNSLNSNAYRGVAQPFLIELSRVAGVRRTLYTALGGGTRDEKIYLGQVFARTGDQDSLQYLDSLAKDPDTAVAEQGLKSLKTLKARL
jgi:HEAT repeat protein